MLRDGIIRVPGQSGVGGHPRVVIEHLHQGGGDADLDGFAPQPIRHAIIVTIHLNVIVAMDLGEAPFGVLISGEGQRVESRTSFLPEGRPRSGNF